MLSRDKPGTPFVEQFSFDYLNPANLITHYRKKCLFALIIKDVSLIIGLITDLVKGYKEQLEDLNVVDCFCLVDYVVNVFAIGLQCCEDVSLQVHIVFFLFEG